MKGIWHHKADAHLPIKLTHNNLKKQYIIGKGKASYSFLNNNLTTEQLFTKSFNKRICFKFISNFLVIYFLRFALIHFDFVFVKIIK